MSYPYRCTNSKCQTRRSLNKQIQRYSRKPTCKECGSPLRFDRWRFLNRSKDTCNDTRCLYFFPHRKGSKWCIHNQSEWNEMEAREFMQGAIYRGL